MTNNSLILYPLILTFSLSEKGLMVFPDGHYLTRKISEDRKDLFLTYSDPTQ